MNIEKAVYRNRQNLKENRNSMFQTYLKLWQRLKKSVNKESK